MTFETEKAKLGAVFSNSVAVEPPAACSNLEISDVISAGCGYMAALLEAADIPALLAQTPRFTLFAPTDEAFASLPAALLETLLDR
jgi:uncharacterized surface protein with fasciclin (FAS1) repeats